MLAQISIWGRGDVRTRIIARTGTSSSCECFQPQRMERNAKRLPIETSVAGDMPTVVKMVDYSYKLSSAIHEDPRLADRRPNCSGRLRPGISPGNTDLVPAQAATRGELRTTAGTGLGPRLRFTSRCCAASAGLSCPEIAPQYVHTCFTRFLTGTMKAT